MYILTVDSPSARCDKKDCKREAGAIAERCPGIKAGVLSVRRRCPSFIDLLPFRRRVITMPVHSRRPAQLFKSFIVVPLVSLSRN
jgi:hypothetical protein